MIVSGQFNDSLAPIVDGVAVTAQNYAYWLHRNHGPSFAVGPRVPGYVDTEPNVLRYRSLSFHSSGPYRLGVPRIDRSFSGRIEMVPFDIVHAHCPFVSGNYALSLSRKRRIPLVATFHSKYRDDFAKWLRLDGAIDQAVSLIVRFYEEADAVWVPNTAIIDTFREYGYRGPIDFVPNGSDIGVEDASERARLRAIGRAMLGCDDATLLLLYVGQYRWLKNLRLMLDALRMLRESGIDFAARFVGEGSDRSAITSYAQEADLGSCVTFVGPEYDRDRLSAMYAAADLFLFPSLYDNASLATREAAGLGVPTLFVKGATTANGIEDGVNGFLSENDPESFSARISAILQDEAERVRVGRGARESLYIPWEKVAAVVFEKYKEIIDRYKRRFVVQVVEHAEDSGNRPMRGHLARVEARRERRSRSAETDTRA